MNNLLHFDLNNVKIFAFLSLYKLILRGFLRRRPFILGEVMSGNSFCTNKSHKSLILVLKYYWMQFLTIFAFFRILYCIYISIFLINATCMNILAIFYTQFLNKWSFWRKSEKQYKIYFQKGNEYSYF